MTTGDYIESAAAADLSRAMPAEPDRKPKPVYVTVVVMQPTRHTLELKGVDTFCSYADVQNEARVQAAEFVKGLPDGSSLVRVDL